MDSEFLWYFEACMGYEEIATATFTSKEKLDEFVRDFHRKTILGDIEKHAVIGVQHDEKDYFSKKNENYNSYDLVNNKQVIHVSELMSTNVTMYHKEACMFSYSYGKMPYPKEVSNILKVL
jgi:hypothetical protein